jgi:glycosyltransferase involved in cell wall biosynthesis
MFLGQKYRYKGIRSLLEATELVWSQMPKVQFVFIGPRTAYSGRLFLKFPDERIIELGIVDLATKSSALQAADVVCVPSNQESFGGVFVEAWASGSPVVGGDCPAVREVISDGKDGFIVQQNPVQIADRLIRLLRDPMLRLRMAGTGMEKVNARYSWEHIAARTEEAYQLARKNTR